MKEAFGLLKFRHDALVPFARPRSTKSPVATTMQSLVMCFLKFDAEIVNVCDALEFSEPGSNQQSQALGNPANRAQDFLGPGVKAVAAIDETIQEEENPLEDAG